MLKFLRQKSRQRTCLPTRQGFTLVELLIVITIIGILATIVLVSLSDARTKARDVRRLADIRQLALALEIYYDDAGSYISVSGCVIVNESNLGDLTPDTMSVLPNDPSPTGNYYYGASGNNQDYVIRTIMEGDTLDGGYPNDLYDCSCDQINEYCLAP